MKGPHDERVLPPQRPYQQDSKIGILFEHDFIVAKILKHLVKDSIPECRRVCKQWYKICSEFPIEIKYKISLDSLPALARSFSKIEELNVQNADSLEKALSTSVELFKSLQTLSITISKEDGNESLECLEEDFRLISRIPSLEIRYLRNSFLRRSFLSLSFLSNLTSLEIDGIMDVNKVIGEEPFYTLTKIRELNVPAFVFWNSNGELMFPSLTKLTCLRVVYGFSRISGNAIQVIYIFNKNLLSFASRH